MLYPRRFILIESVCHENVAYNFKEQLKFFIKEIDLLDENLSKCRRAKEALTLGDVHCGRRWEGGV